MLWMQNRCTSNQGQGVSGRGENGSDEGHLGTCGSKGDATTAVSEEIRDAWIRSCQNWDDIEPRHLREHNIFKITLSSEIEGGRKGGARKSYWIFNRLWRRAILSRMYRCHCWRLPMVWRWRCTNCAVLADITPVGKNQARPPIYVRHLTNAVRFWSNRMTRSNPVKSNDPIGGNRTRGT